MQPLAGAVPTGQSSSRQSQSRLGGQPAGTAAAGTAAAGTAAAGPASQLALPPTLMVVSSLPENTTVSDAARARTAPLCPTSVARHLCVLTSHTRTVLSYEPLKTLSPQRTSVRTA